jgi:hypothetical protein
MTNYQQRAAELQASQQSIVFGVRSNEEPDDCVVGFAHSDGAVRLRDSY